MRILVVEDNQKIAAAIRKGLSQESYAVDVLADGQVGLERAISEVYDLIILDVMLPSLNGFEICKTLRSENLQTPILMLTAKGSTEDKISGFNYGADDYLVKPFDFDEFVARVRALIRRPKHQQTTILTCGDLSLNTNTKEVYRDTIQVDLSKREFALLDFLMRNQKQVLTKDQIIQHVWEYDADVLPNTVEVYIGYLRNKVDKPFRTTSLIKTVRGFGYRMGIE